MIFLEHEYYDLTKTLSECKGSVFSLSLMRYSKEILFEEVKFKGLAVNH